MTEKHLSSQFDSELNSVSARVMELGGLVESQIQHAIHALAHFSLESVAQVDALEQRVNTMEVEIDHELSTIIARRQPTARDLRLLIAFSKATANLERMGDEAHKAVELLVNQVVFFQDGDCRLGIEPGKRVQRLAQQARGQIGGDAQIGRRQLAR